MGQDRENRSQVIDFSTVFNVLKVKWKKILRVSIAFMILSAIYVYSLPRGYEATVKLAPETSSMDGIAGSMSGLASMVGISLGGGGEDAIYPEIYPEVVGSTRFITGLFDVGVQSADADIDTNLYEYYKTFQDEPWWSGIIEPAKRFLKNLLKSEDSANLNNADSGVNPFWLSKKEDEICMAIANSMSCSVDKKTSVITLTYTAQDPLVAASVVDSIRVKLQDFIIEYRTLKARNDLEYAEKLCESSRLQYDKAQKAYSDFCDANRNIKLQSLLSEQERLQNELQMALTAYTQFAQQVQYAQAKVQERTPSFTVIQNPTVPQKPSSPKRMFSMMVFFVLGALCSSIYYCYKDIIRNADEESVKS